MRGAVAYRQSIATSKQGGPTASAPARISVSMLARPSSVLEGQPASPPHPGSRAHALWWLLSYPCDNDDPFSVATEGFGCPRLDLWCEDPWQWQLIGRSQVGDLVRG